MSQLGKWFTIDWEDGDYRVVKRVICHETELAEVLSLPWPKDAACRRAGVECTLISDNTKTFRRQFYPSNVGDFFQEEINQGLRDCSVIAFDEKTGDYLYEYDMPAGRTFLRNRARRPVSRKKIPKKWGLEEVVF